MKITLGHTITMSAAQSALPMLLCTIIAVVGCQPQLTQTVRSGLVYCSEGSPETFNPQPMHSSQLHNLEAILNLSNVAGLKSLQSESEVQILT